MGWANHLRVHMTGGDYVSHENGKAILTGHYPNPEAGERILTVFYWLGHCRPYHYSRDLLQPARRA